METEEAWVLALLPTSSPPPLPDPPAAELDGGGRGSEDAPVDITEDAVL